MAEEEAIRCRRIDLLSSLALEERDGLHRLDDQFPLFLTPAVWTRGDSEVKGSLRHYAVVAVLLVQADASAFGLVSGWTS